METDLEKWNKWKHKEIIKNYILTNFFENIAIVGSGKHKDMVYYLRSKTNVDCYDFRPRFLPHYNKYDYDYKCVDVIFDDCDFSTYDCVVNMSAERMYPMAKIHPGNYVLVLDKENKDPRVPTSPDSNHYLIENDRIDTGRKIIIYGRTKK